MRTRCWARKRSAKSSGPSAIRRSAAWQAKRGSYRAVNKRPHRPKVSTGNTNRSSKSGTTASIRPSEPPESCSRSAANLFVAMPDDTLLDDFILSMRIAMQGYRIAYCKNAYALEEASADMTEEGKRKVRIAAGGLQSIGQARAAAQPIALRHTLVAIPLAPRTALVGDTDPAVRTRAAEYRAGRRRPAPDFLRYDPAAASGFLRLRTARLPPLQRKIKNKLLFVPYYFLFMNLNVLRGIAYLRRRRGQQTARLGKSEAGCLNFDRIGRAQRYSDIPDVQGTTGTRNIIYSGNNGVSWADNPAKRTRARAGNPVNACP